MHVQLPTGDAIVIRGARQNNLKNLSLAIPTGELVGTPGSVQASLRSSSTRSKRGPRRYVETFSPYARQFLDRRTSRRSTPSRAPAAIASTRPTRCALRAPRRHDDELTITCSSSRASAALLRGCGKPVTANASSIFEDLQKTRAPESSSLPVPIRRTSREEIEECCSAGLYAVLRDPKAARSHQDRTETAERARGLEALEAALSL